MSRPRYVAVFLLAMLASLSAETPQTPVANPNPNAVLILGTGEKHSAHGILRTDNEGITFEHKGHTTKIPTAVLEKVTVGSGLRETGGLPMTAAKIAIPYGGGRVVSLFAHVKYDTLTVEYRDENGAYHGALFNLPKGQGDPMQAALGAFTARPPAAAAASVQKNDKPGWAIQVEPLNPGETAVSREFLVATYERLIEQLERSHRYTAVLRSGDTNAGKYAQLLVLNMDVKKFVAGNEEARAVTTVKGWTKLGVNMHLQTSDGKALLDKSVESNVRFYGNNLRATRTIAGSMDRLMAEAGFPN